MFLEEAQWLERVLGRQEAERLSPLLNLGSSTRKFRQEEKPHIHRHVFAPLAERGVLLVHSDLKTEDGVDIAGDIFEDATFARLKALCPRAVLCTNMLEHVPDYRRLVAMCLSLLSLGGLLFVTVPCSYPYHPDPIDNGLRSTPEELAALFAPNEVVESAVIEGETYGQELRNHPRAVAVAAVRLCTPFIRFDSWKGWAHRLGWLFRHYQVSCVVIRKTV